MQMKNIDYFWLYKNKKEIKRNKLWHYKLQMKTLPDM
mgnify:CR=1 FL=1